MTRKQAREYTVGGYPIDRMPYVEEEKKRPRFLRDEIMQITWYVVYGSIHEQKNVIIYEMLPHVMSVMKEDYGEILWIPCPMDYEEADYKRDYKEVLDCVEKVAEYNARYGTRFRMGFGKMWMPMGVEFEKESRPEKSAPPATGGTSAAAAAASAPASCASSWPRGPRW